MESELIPDAPTERALPPEEGDVTAQGLKTAEELVRIENRRRRAKLTFWLGTAVGILVLMPFIAIAAGVMVRIFLEVAGL